VSSTSTTALGTADPAEWVKQVTTPSELQPQYGLMWWLYTWNGYRVYAARGSADHLIVLVPDQKSVTTITSASRQEYPMDDEALFPLMNEVIIPVSMGSRRPSQKGRSSREQLRR